MEISLAELTTGERGRIVRFEGGWGFQARLEALGLRENKTVQKVANQPLRGPVVVEVDGCRIAIGRGMAAKVFVEVQ